MKTKHIYINDKLHVICGLCGVTIGTASADYGGTDACEVWEVERWEEHVRECPTLREDARHLAAEARAWGHENITEEDFLSQW
ncbi:MAG: hypothetical protein JRI54_00070 [Deltaproteobacteria bacterium]|nr:hypothetical protein [Deltaproteobacteria bacterium]